MKTQGCSVRRPSTAKKFTSSDICKHWPQIYLATPGYVGPNCDAEKDGKSDAHFTTLKKGQICDRHELPSAYGPRANQDPTLVLTSVTR